MGMKNKVTKNTLAINEGTHDKKYLEQEEFYRD